jgi:phospholipid-transporting ATPase
VERLCTFRGEFNGIPPDKELHEFNSTLRLEEGLGDIAFRKDKQLLYREARLKNTKWIYGLVIYTGRNSKIMMNSQGGTNKMSQIEIKVNYILAFILALQLALCIILGALDGNFLRNHSNTDNYILWGSNSPAGDGLLMFCTYLVLLNTMIPISLIVSMEIVKMSQSYFIDNDRFMYSEFRERGPTVRSASLNEELGQIEYVFTDKTGTLTTNRMEFKIALIGHRLFGDLGLIASDVPLQKGSSFEDRHLQDLLSRGAANEYISSFIAKNREGTFTQEINNLKELAHEYFTALAVAHEVVVAADSRGVLRYQGPSPDEITLVEAAKVMGYEFLSSTQKSTLVSINKTEKEFQLLESFAFTSDRKRMSVIVRDGGKIKLYIKGADNIIKARLAPNQTFELDYELDRFSRIGLRTLLIAMRHLSEEEYTKYKKDCESLPLEGKEKAMEPLISKLEENLYVIGATAVLDRLQDEVPETIRDLIRASTSHPMQTSRCGCSLATRWRLPRTSPRAATLSRAISLSSGTSVKTKIPPSSTGSWSNSSTRPRASLTTAKK